MNTPLSAIRGSPPALRRLAAISPLGGEALRLLEMALRKTKIIKARRDILKEGDPLRTPWLVVGGWAARARILADGRRQILGFYLPGDIIGLARHGSPAALATISSITDLQLCPAPPAEGLPDLEEAYDVSLALDEAYLLAHVTRLGRLTAQERVGDLLLELHDRLALAGLTDGASFEIPLTQEMLADLLGLTAVHINRTLQAARADREIVWKAGRVELSDYPCMAGRVRNPVPDVRAIAPWRPAVVV